MIEFIERQRPSFEHVDGDILLTANMIEQVSAKCITEDVHRLDLWADPLSSGDPPGAAHADSG